MHTKKFIIIIFLFLIFLPILSVQAFNSLINSPNNAKIIITMPNMTEQKYGLLEVEASSLDVWQVLNGIEVFFGNFSYDSSIENYSLDVEPGEYLVKRYVNGEAEEEYVEMGWGDVVVIPLYKEETAQREFIVDAPWRITSGNDIPILFEIRDSDGIGYAYSFYSIKLFDGNNNNNLVKEFSYSDLGLPKDGGWPCDDYATITDRVWYKVMYVSPNLFVKDDNNIIKITTVYDGSVCGGDWDAEPNNEPYPLIVSVENKNIPRYYNWYCGDTHYHSSYTDTKFLASLKGEFGGPIDATINMLDAISLDWITVTDHSNSFSQHKNDTLGLTWEDFKNDCNNHDECLIGTEINCDYALIGGGNHLLAYDYKNYIEDNFIDILSPNNPSCEKMINNISNQGGFTYAAHPESIFDPFGAIVNTWHNYSLPFTGLQVWNTNIKNPENGKQAIEALESGLSQWTTLLLQGRKVFISAGSDAHGDFQEFGKEYTCCRSPHNQQDPNFKQLIFNALEQGNCYMSNNGALVMYADDIELESLELLNSSGKLNSLEFLDDSNNSEVYELGRIVNETLGAEINMSPGYGFLALVGGYVIDSCDLRIYRGVIGEEQETLIYDMPGNSGVFQMQFSEIPTSPTYYRAECISPDNKSRIYTNPIWVNPIKRTLEPNVYINEVELNPEGSDYGNEWVELYNYGPPVNLNGWHIQNKDGYNFSLPDVTLNRLVVNDFYIFDEFPGYALTNSGDNISLFDNNNNLIDSTGILSDSGNDNRTKQRIPDGDGSFEFKEQTFQLANEPETLPMPYEEPLIPTIDFTILPSLDFQTIKPGQQSEIINSTITVTENNNQNFTMIIELSSPSNLFSNIFFDINQNSIFEPGEQLNQTLQLSIKDIDGEHIIEIPAILKVPVGYKAGHQSGKITYTIVGGIG